MNKKTTQNIIDELNRLGGHWAAIDGVRALTQVTKEGDSYNFNPASGVLVKVFIDNDSGEMKLFPALMVEDSF